MARATTLRIVTPRAGTTVRFRERLRVTGLATPGTTVLVSACAEAGCSAAARAGADGKWQVTIRPRDARTTIEAGTAATNAIDRVRIRVRRPHGSAAPVTESESQPTPRPRPTSVVVIGDSLAVGTRELLPPLLRGFTVSTDALTGRPLAAGMAIAARSDLSDAVAVFSLFTNDDPRHVDELERAVRASVRASRCAVWATIARPPYMGVSYAAANERLHLLATELYPRMQLVPWAALAGDEPELLAPDGVHATPAGYQRRAVLYAAAIGDCANSA